MAASSVLNDETEAGCRRWKMKWLVYPVLDKSANTNKGDTFFSSPAYVNKTEDKNWKRYTQRICNQSLTILIEFWWQRTTDKTSTIVQERNVSGSSVPRINRIRWIHTNGEQWQSSRRKIEKMQFHGIVHHTITVPRKVTITIVIVSQIEIVECFSYALFSIFSKADKYINFAVNVNF